MHTSLVVTTGIGWGSGSGPVIFARTFLLSAILVVILLVVAGGAIFIVPILIVFELVQSATICYEGEQYVILWV